MPEGQTPDLHLLTAYSQDLFSCSVYRNGICCLNTNILSLQKFTLFLTSLCNPPAHACRG